MPVFLSDLRGLTFSGCGYPMKIRFFLIGTIICPVSNIPPVSTSTDEATKFFCVCKTVSMGTFSLGLGVSVGDRWYLR